MLDLANYGADECALLSLIFTTMQLENSNSSLVLEVATLLLWIIKEIKYLVPGYNQIDILLSLQQSYLRIEYYF